MSTFSKLSTIAQLDDSHRYINSVLQDFQEAEEAKNAGFKELLWMLNGNHKKEKQQLQSRISHLDKLLSEKDRETKKISRQLTEARSAVSRERELRAENKELRQHLDYISKLANKGAHAELAKCLENRRLSPILAEDSDDCVSGIEYDRTEEDIIDSPRKSQAFVDALENLRPNEQPTLMLESLRDEPRRSTRLAGHRRSRQDSSENSNPTTASSSNNINKYVDSDTNSLETDDQDIEYVRQQLQKYEADKRDKLASAISTPNIKELKKGATISARSAANLMRTASHVGTPVSNALKPHSFVQKKAIVNDNCVTCGFKVKFYSVSHKCQVCNITCHPDCKENAPLPCVKITAPTTRSKQRKILISDYVSSDANPKVPALIVHCCNEIESDHNIITPALYQAIGFTKDIEELQQKILRSKSGMPNLSKVDVHLLTGVVKRFLQSLDESLLTTTLWNYFAEAIKLTGQDSRTHISYYIENDLPPANRDTLSFLMQHLHAVARHANENLMDTKKLAKVFAPTIVGNSSRNPDQTKISNETKIQVQVMESLFGIEEEFWAGFVQRMSANSRAATSLGSRLLSGTPKDSKTRDSRIGSTLPTPKLKPLFK